MSADKVGGVVIILLCLAVMRWCLQALRLLLIEGYRHITKRRHPRAGCVGCTNWGKHGIDLQAGWTR